MSDFTNNIENDASKPVLCVTCKQFFGNKMTEGLCSKCHRDNTNKAKTSTETQAMTLISKASAVSNEDTLSQVKSNLKEESKSDVVVSNETKEIKEEKAPEKQVDLTRCFSCSKKVGLLGFKCKCESMFCRTHRQPEMHECSFDFAKAGKERLAKENVAVIAAKIEKI
mmetsp:Transcript_64164/g.74578  ORF Transcript_64164/g.74578 Transcript_64164/m.74578 type:complete len:168 (-) Transcript_64164:2-505(-)|eukprot:CAMPEP_0176419682 /NCGR_PEP_ID=MMETSP0127-20121128/8192_1 /TAXON_ID=938130 /ORGANISM="Platyophrya macrostoma, Strain WH" /LENGTH=167 /DNA_ID=CAMNT_0017800205 /DNA_START=36 /DNA_END=539 /DNA_ORIENTATION=-